MTDVMTQFQSSLQEYVDRFEESTSHDARRPRFMTWARDALGVDFDQLEIEERVYRGRVDALLGNLVFEFKRDLEHEREDAEVQLTRYMGDLSGRHPGATFTGVATDGLRFRVYMPILDSGTVTDLQPTGELDLGREPDAETAFLWLDSLFSHLREGRTTPTSRSMLAALGPASPTFRQAVHTLAGLYRQAKDEPDVEVRFREWRSYLSIVYGEPLGDEELFVVHTYLATLARLIALYILQPDAFLADNEDHIKVVNGEYFRERDIYNFVEEDLFTWTLSPKVLDDSLELVRRLVSSLAAYDLASAGPDLLKGLYQELVDPPARHELGEQCTPDWLAEYVLQEQLRLRESPHLSVLDPSCGSGTFLFTAIRLIRDGMAHQGKDDVDILLHILDGVMGVDVHPVAVAIARTNYLLALGDLITGPHPPVLVPVYLANSIQPPETTSNEPPGDHEEAVYTIQTAEPEAAFQIPDSMVQDPAQLDWLLHRLAQYLRAAEVRAPHQGAERATEEVIGSLYSYLTSPKLAGLRELPALSTFAANVLCQTTRTLIKLTLEGKDTVWLNILKNAPTPAYLSRRKFDLVVGDPPQLPKEMPAKFFDRSADLYLRDGGTIAFIMPPAAMPAEQQFHFRSLSFEGGKSSLRLEKVLDLDQGNPPFDVPCCLVVARKPAGDL